MIQVQLSPVAKEEHSYLRGKPRSVKYSKFIQGDPSDLRLGFVDLDFEYSTVCLILLELMGIWQKRLDRWARWWNTEIKVNSTQVSAHLGHPVVCSRGWGWWSDTDTWIL